MLVACVFKAVTADTGPLARTVDKGWIIWSYGHNYTEIGFARFVPTNKKQKHILY